MSNDAAHAAVYAEITALIADELSRIADACADVGMDAEQILTVLRVRAKHLTMKRGTHE